jgi:excisionase family DNA binding protein
MKTLTQKQLFSTEEAAKALGVTDRRVRQMIDEGAIGATKVALTWVVTKAELDAAVANRQNATR